jgi:hypothetical protein
MLISHRYKFIYTKTVKTASTSVEAYFERFCLPAGDELPPTDARDEHESATGVIGYRGKLREPRKWFQYRGKRLASPRWFHHMPAERIRRQIGPEIWDSYFKFCVVRNPFEKAISAFEHLGRDHVVPSGVTSVLFRRKHRACTPEQLRFLHWMTKRGLPRDRDKLVIGSSFCLDDVIRYESLETEMARICHRIGVPWEPARLPRLKTDMRRPESTAATLYTPAAIRLVERAYAFELRHFGYSYPGDVVRDSRR